MPVITDTKLEELLLERRQTKNLDPLVSIKFTTLQWFIYMIRFTVEFPLTLLMCVWGFFLALYGYIKLYKNVKRTNLLNFDKIQKKLNKNPLKFISIIIPMYNEEFNIQTTLLYLDLHSVDKDNIEIILVDGGSKDNTIGKINEIKKYLNINIKLIQTDKYTTGRGICQNIGVKNVSNKCDILVFLHGDTILSSEYDKSIRNNLNLNSKIIIGSFKFTVDRGNMLKPLVGLGCMELFARIRNVCYWLPYGDQGYFLRKDMYNILGGFPDVVIVEDFIFTGKARKCALENNGIIFINKLKAYCSPRRWHKNGVARNTMWNQIVVYCYTQLNYTPEQIYKMYYGKEVPRKIKNN